MPCLYGLQGRCRCDAQKTRMMGWYLLPCRMGGKKGRERSEKGAWLLLTSVRRFSAFSLIKLALPPFLRPAGIAFSLITVLRAGAHFCSSFL